MNMLSFLGETPTIALQNAQNECGENAYVISTKKISDEFEHGKNMYEVIVAIEENSEKQEQIYKRKIVAKDLKTGNQVKAQFYDFREEILKMQDAILQVQKSIWDPKSQLYDLTIPCEFVDIYSLFEQNEFDQEMTYTIMKKTIKQLPVAMKVSPKKINDFFKLILRRIIPIKFEEPLRKHQRKIVMMVGPTGVGKTTTIAKLAARYAYKMSANYKVGAIEQLQAYTNIMRLPLGNSKKTRRFSRSSFTP